MKFLIAGFGSIGRRHLNNLKALGETDLLLYRTHHSTLPVEEIGDVPVAYDLASALDQHPDAVIISNPSSLHLDVAIPAARAGCSILMEKPVSDSFDRIDELKQALRSGGGRFVTAFQYRFHPGLRQVKAWLEAGEIGGVVSARARWGEYLPNWHPWEDYRNSYAARKDLGGGVVNTLCHPLDYLRWMFGEVESLWAYTSNASELHLEVEDTAEIGLQFKNSVLGSVHLDYLQQPGQHTLEIIGSRGTLQWNNATGIARHYHAADQKWVEVSPPSDFERNKLFLNEMAHFIRVVKDEEQPLCTLADGLSALKLTTAVHTSAKLGCLVKLDEFPED
ncbi:MAG: Gfo/Idh/MocA family oxidoreductase [Anaerolineaceae bacterium]